ncbi:MAG: type II toxin-antitoxin system RelE/ParE family toxin [Proteobacteria bacterium]|nr:type II toxin-antitoxin system RelE/ParE family toxin [Pseudomonadota bacterium]
MKYEVIETDIFIKWRLGLRDAMAKARIDARLRRAENGNFGDWKTESGDIRAIRIDHGPGYRLYYVMRGNTIIFMLCGGDKRNQQADISKALEIAKEIKNETL